MKLIDTSRDAGLTIGPPPATNYYQMQIEAQNGGADSLVSFKIPDITDVQNEAYTSRPLPTPKQKPSALPI